MSVQAKRGFLPTDIRDFGDVRPNISSSSLLTASAVASGLADKRTEI